MRKSSLYIALAFVLNSCVYHDFPIVTWGSIEVTLNNEAWDAQRYPSGEQRIAGGHYGPFAPCTTKYYSINSLLLNSDSFRQESLLIELAAFPPGNKGRFRISNSLSIGRLPCVDEPLVISRFFTIAQDGDVLQDVYDVLESEDNYIEIHSFDPETLEIRGTFQVTFVVTDRGIEPSSLPDTLRFTKGSFETRIFD